MKHKFVIAVITTGIFLFGAAAAVCADDTNMTAMTQPAIGTTSEENNVSLSSESSDDNAQTSGAGSELTNQENLGENQEQGTTSSEQTISETWVNENGSKYYYDKTGSKVRGISKIEDTIYYFDPNTGALVQQAGWKDWNGKKYYTNSQGVAFAGMFISFGTPRYYMGGDGAVMTGLFTAADGRRYNADETGQIVNKAQWIEKDGKKYYSSGQGELYRNQFISFGTPRYYMGNDGAVMTGLFTAADGRRYNADETGQIINKAQWIEKDGKKYYSNGQGELYRNQFISFGTPRYYMGNDGAVMTGLFTAADGRRYNADETGQIVNKAQWIEKDGKKYYSNGQGELYRNQFISFGTPRYYMGNDGAVMTGLFTAADGRRYNADETGQIVNKAQWIEKDGKKYYSNGQGELYRNQFISFGTPRYYMGNDGAVMTGLFTAADGRRYNADETGQIVNKAQWIEKDGNKYYSNGQGELYRNQFISFGTPRYYMGNDGAVMTGLFTAADGRRYNADETGQIINKAQWIEKDGKKYYSNGQGELYRNQFISFGTPRYYMGNDGAVVTGLFTAADGRRYNADETGQIINKAQWIEKDGKKYYSDSHGELYMDCIISFGNDHYYLGRDGALVTGSFYYDGSRYTTNDKGVINEPIVHTWMSNMNSLARSLWSSTNYKILVDRNTNVLGVYQLSSGLWNPIAFWSCSTGASQTPTPSGVFQTGLKGYSFGHGYTCYYWTGFIGSQYLFHSTLYSQGTFNSIDSRLGLNISHGCVRLAIESAKWIYDNIPTGTAVRIY